jgi:hypothetical protein
MSSAAITEKKDLRRMATPDKDLEKLNEEAAKFVDPNSNEAVKKRIDYKKFKDNEKITGVFRNLEEQGGGVRFCLKLYPGDDLEWYDMVDGHTYTVPRMVGDHLNKDCWIDIYGHGKNSEGLNVQQVTGKRHRYAFDSPDLYYDNLDKTHDIVYVSSLK